jgi:hypothetical protein
MIREEKAVKDLDTGALRQLQAHLQKLGYYSDKIDGLYGPNTFNAWAKFKESVGMGQRDKLDKIGPASWAALLEKSLGHVPKRDHDFSTKQGTIKAILWECDQQGLKLLTQKAYVLATVEHETAGSFKPVEEGYYLGGAERVKAFQKTLRYWPYFGRGYVQLTWERNYAKYSRILGVDMVKNPHIATVPNVALFILVHGFKTGAFTGHTLERHVREGKTDFLNARRCINGTDRAGYISQIANGWLAKLPRL